MLALRVAAYSSSKPALGGAQRASASGRSRALALPPLASREAWNVQPMRAAYPKAVTRRTGLDGALQSREANAAQRSKTKNQTSTMHVHTVVKVRAESVADAIDRVNRLLTDNGEYHID